MEAVATEFIYTRPPLYQKQHDAFFSDDRYSICEASTKAGKTVGAMAWLFEQAFKGKAHQNFFWVAPVYLQTKIAFRRFKNGLPKNTYTANESELSLTLANQTIVWFKSAEKPDNLYGEDVFAAVADEASRMREESWFALRTTLTATKAPVRIIGNVKGRKNWFYKLARKAEAGAPNMRYQKITAHDAIAAGVLDKEEIDDAKATLPKEVFEELYLAIPTEDGSNPFGITDIRECIKPLSTLPPEVFGVDLAKSVDWTVIIGLDKNRDVCRMERFQKSWTDTLTTVERVCGNLPCLVDSTGVGDPILEGLQAKGARNFEGFKFTAHSKQQIMEGLAVAIQQKNIGYPAGVIPNELEAFEYEYTRTGVRYSSPSGMHDDTVCALALANDFKAPGAGIFF